MPYDFWPSQENLYPISFSQCEVKMEGKNNRHCVACVRTPSIASFDKSSIKRISRTVGDPAPKCLNETQPHDVIMLFLPFAKEL